MLTDKSAISEYENRPNVKLFDFQICRSISHGIVSILTIYSANKMLLEYVTVEISIFLNLIYFIQVIKYNHFMTTIWGSTSAGDIKLKIIFTNIIISNRIVYKIYLYMYSFSFMFYRWRKFEFSISLSCTESLMKCPESMWKVYFTWG